MKKIYKIGSVLLAALTTASLAACGGTVIDSSSDDNSGKISIFISVDMGGNGSAWIEEMAAEWNATQEDYRIVIDCDRKVTTDWIDQQTLNPNGKYSAFFLPFMNMQQLAQKGQIEDLSDIANATVTGESRTIWSKVRDKELWKAIGSKNDGSGQYILPYADSFIGMVFDYDFFLERGYLTYAPTSALNDINASGTVAAVDGQKVKCTVKFGNYEVGDYILTAGKDGKYGTYDDGQPTTQADFNELLALIAEKDKTFLYSGQQPGYVEAISQAIFGQYVGSAGYETYYTFDSKGEKVKLYDVNTNTTTEKEITLDNGYEVYGMEGLYKMTSLTKDWFLNKNQYHKYSEKNEQPMVIQKDFLNGFRELDGNPYAGFLIEGCWWENEARGYFEELGARYSDRGYGKREYRYMLLPTMPGQATDSDKTKFFSQDSGSFVVAKHDDTDAAQAKLAKLKEFLITTLSDENLRRYTRMTGIVRPYDYELTEGDLAQMTPFARNVWEIYADTEHVEVLHGFLYRAAEPLYRVSYNGKALGDEFPVLLDGIATSLVAPMLDGASVKDIFNSMKNRYDATYWANLVKTAKDSGWYQTQA